MIVASCRLPRWIPVLSRRPALAPVTPLPVKATDCCRLAALSVSVRSPARGPARLGVKVRMNTQLAPGAMVTGTVPQVVGCLESPEVVIAVTISGSGPLLTRGIVSGELGG